MRQKNVGKLFVILAKFYVKIFREFKYLGMMRQCFMFNLQPFFLHKRLAVP